MSRHKIISDDGAEWSVGFDNQGGGFFATRFLPEECDQEADVLIGFSVGVGIDELIRDTGEHGLVLDMDMIEMLLLDRELETKPLTTTQQLVRDIFEGLGLFD